MKLAGSLLACAALAAAASCPHGGPPPAAPAAEEALAAAEPAAEPATTDPFTAKVVPVLRANCSPCHFPGGELYERLPFDDAGTVAGVAEGILRRLQGSDRAVVREVLEFAGH